MTVERCEECGFDGADWSDSDAIEAVRGLPRRWAEAVSAMTVEDLCRRPVERSWSVGEYADHVREVLFGMRFLLDTAVSQPGTDLGAAPESVFDPEPRVVDGERSLMGIGREAALLVEGLAALTTAEWTATVILDGEARDPRWIVRHAVHDATHHLLDVERLRAAL
jgi:hypothetical protein